MIISHQHRFIFIKTEKTAGTSIEIALSKYCGPEDVITPVSPEDEELRGSLGYRGAQNCNVALSRYKKRDWARLLLRGERLKFPKHARASFVRDYVRPEVWNAYFKFCFERNPWDKVVSYYYYKTRRFAEESRPSISEFIGGGQASQIGGFDLYSIDQRIAVDRVCLYESLDEEIDALTRRLKLPERPLLPRAKSSFRVDRRGYKELLTAEDRDRLARAFAREIEHFHYQW